MLAPTHTLLSATLLLLLGAGSLASVVSAVSAADIDPQGCTISPDNLGCPLHRPQELEQRDESADRGDAVSDLRLEAAPETAPAPTEPWLAEVETEAEVEAEAIATPAPSDLAKLFAPALETE